MQRYAAFGFQLYTSDSYSFVLIYNPYWWSVDVCILLSKPSSYLVTANSFQTIDQAYEGDIPPMFSVLYPRCMYMTDDESHLLMYWGFNKTVITSSWKNMLYIVCHFANNNTSLRERVQGETISLLLYPVISSKLG